MLLKYKQKRTESFEKNQMNVESEIWQLSNKIIATNSLESEQRMREEMALLHKIKIEQQILNKIKQKMHIESQNQSRIECIFITFQRIKDRNFFLELLAWNLSHVISKFSKKKQLRLLEGDELIYASIPAIPSNMKWHNYSYSSY